MSLIRYIIYYSRNSGKFDRDFYSCVVYLLLAFGVLCFIIKILEVIHVLTKEQSRQLFLDVNTLELIFRAL